MHYIFDILRFGAPYLRRHWLPLVAGILFSIVFGLSNGSLVWGTKTILERLSPQPASAAGQGGGEIGSRLQSATFRVVDSWLPRVGRDIDGVAEGSSPRRHCGESRR